jgi:acyl-CoA thioesterase-2
MTRPARMRPPLAETLQLDELGPNTYRGHSPDTSMTRVFGGQAAAQALVAAGRTVPEDRVAHSLHAYFLQRGDATKPIDFEVTALRDSRSYNTRSVTASQDGRPILQLVASFQVPATGIAHQVPSAAAPAPETLPPSEDVFRDGDDRSRTWYAGFRQHFPLDIRFVGEPPRIAVARGEIIAPRHTLWVRTAESLPDDPRVHTCALAYMSDVLLLSSALPPHGFSFGDEGLLIASLDHAVWFHAPVQADDWLLYDEEGFWADGGRALSRGHFFNRDGLLVASVMQEGVIRVPRAD